MIPEKIIISRTDAIGDVVLTLPLAVYLKQQKPGCEIIFLGRNYTKPIVELCPAVDIFISWDDISNNSVEELKKLIRTL